MIFQFFLHKQKLFTLLSQFFYFCPKKGKIDFTNLWTIFDFSKKEKKICTLISQFFLLRQKNGRNHFSNLLLFLS